MFNPSTGEILGSVPDMDQRDAKSAIEVARNAFDTWKNVSARVCFTEFSYILHYIFAPHWGKEHQRFFLL